MSNKSPKNYKEKKLIFLLAAIGFLMAFLAIWTGLYFIFLLIFSSVLFLFSNYANGIKKRYSRIFHSISFILPIIISVFLIRALFFEIYIVSSSSMKESLHPGDVLLINKLIPGPRIGIFNKNKRAKGIRDINRGDIIVFNYPEGDSVIKENPVIDYRVAKRKNIPLNGIKPDYVEISKRLKFVKRCVALPGDTLFYKNGNLIVNNKKVKYKTECFSAKIITNGKPLSNSTIDKVNFTKEDIKNSAASVFEYILNISEKEKEIFEKDQNVKSVTKIKYPKNLPYNNLIFPHKKKIKNTIDNFDTIIVPKKNNYIKLTPNNYFYYKRIIECYENNDTIKDLLFRDYPENLSILYKFKMNYYWMMGDNRHLSLDSRYWGYLPENHIIGKAGFVFFTLNRYEDKPADNKKRRLKKLDN